MNYQQLPLTAKELATYNKGYQDGKAKGREEFRIDLLRLLRSMKNEQKEPHHEPPQP